MKERTILNYTENSPEGAGNLSLTTDNNGNGHITVRSTGSGSQQVSLNVPPDQLRELRDQLDAYFKEADGEAEQQQEQAAHEEANEAAARGKKPAKRR